MKFNRLVLFMIGVLLLVCSAALFAGEDDMSSLCDEVLAEMRNSRKDVHGDSSWARRLFVNLGSDSNRVCQVAEEVYARSANKMDQEDALLLINRYGSENQRPFVEFCITNAACGRYALIVHRNLFGITTNSIVQVERFRSALSGAFGRQDFENERTLAVVELISRARAMNPTRSVVEQITDYACACMSNSVDFASSVDSALAKTDNRYRMSKRRLDLLRFVRLNSGKERRAGSLDREIEVLEAYPEENLPE